MLLVHAYELIFIFFIYSDHPDAPPYWVESDGRPPLPKM